MRMTRLPHDICRCTTTTCLVRHQCARYMDSPAGPQTPFADLTGECQDIGAERMFIPWREVSTQEHKLPTQEHKLPTQEHKR